MNNNREAESYAPRHWDQPCPKCGLPVDIKHWEGRTYLCERCNEWHDA